MQEDEESDEETREILKKESGHSIDIKSYLENKKKTIIRLHRIKNINKKLLFEKKCAGLENNTHSNQDISLSFLT